MKKISNLLKLPVKSLKIPTKKIGLLEMRTCPANKVVGLKTLVSLKKAVSKLLTKDGL
jgi:hypothetical protein